MTMGKDIIYEVKIISKEYDVLINKFNCGLKSMDEYLKYKALDELNDGDGVTKLFIDTNNNQIIGYYTLSCCSIVAESSSKMYFSPAVEIKMFAINIEYQNMPFSEDYEDGVLSDSLLSFVISEVYDFSENICGVKNIVLYSVPQAEKFYIRNLFEEFKEYMIQDDDRYLNGCIPRYFSL